MTVAELIEWLKTQPQDARVLVLETRLASFLPSQKVMLEVYRQDFDPERFANLDDSCSPPELLLGDDDEGQSPTLGTET